MLRALVYLLFLAWLGPAMAQPAPNTPQLAALKGDYFRLVSNATGRSYHVHVRLPEDYDAEKAARYPVVYVLDGDVLFPVLAASHLFLTIDDKLPEAIIVGIGYGGFDPAINKRNIDFLPPAAGIAPEAAGAPLFQRLLRNELLPAIDRRYRTDPARRIIFGQSRSAGFVIWSALTDPDLFWGGIANNPALEPALEAMRGKAAPATRSDLSLIVTNGTEDRPELRRVTQAWLAERTKRTDDPWKLRGVTIDQGSHAANSLDGYRAGMRILFGHSR
jgi:predicted alpha/beta superfamily hydrolase